MYKIWQKLLGKIRRWANTYPTSIVIVCFSVLFVAHEAEWFANYFIKPRVDPSIYGFIFWINIFVHCTLWNLFFIKLYGWNRSNHKNKRKQLCVNWKFMNQATVSGGSNLIELGSIPQQIVAIGGITGGVVYLRGSEDPTLAELSGSILGGMAGTVVGMATAAYPRASIPAGAATTVGVKEAVEGLVNYSVERIDYALADMGW